MMEEEGQAKDFKYQIENGQCLWVCKRAMATAGTGHRDGFCDALPSLLVKK